MELLDRYLQAVKKHLPWKRQDDIIAELRANLEAQLEDKEAELGRPLTTDESEDWLRQIGPPIRVAARYLPQQYLIGPAIFPTYWYVLRLAFLWSMVIYTIVSALQIATQNPSGAGVLEAVLRVPGILMAVAAWVTLIFAAFEFAATHYPSKCPSIAGVTADWTPSSMPPLETEAAAGDRPRSYAHAVAEVVFGFLGLIWILLVPHYPYLLLGPGAPYVQGHFLFTPLLIQFYWWVVGLNVLQLTWRCIDLLRGDWQGPRRAQHLAVKVFGLVPLGLLIAVRDQAYLTLRHPEVDQASYGVAVNSLNQVIHMGLMVACTIAVLQLLWDMGKIAVESYRKRAAALR